MGEVDRLARITQTHLGGTLISQADISWLIDQVEGYRAEVGRLTSLLLHYDISPHDPAGRYHYAVIVANTPATEEPKP